MVLGVVPSQAQDLALLFVEPHEVPDRLFLQPVEVPLGGSTISWHISLSSSVLSADLLSAVPHHLDR